jgi:acylphosphatase
LKTYELMISGRVQGVNYRKFVLEVAQTLHYCGYVKNLPNSNVQVIVNAEFEEDLEFFISKLHEGSFFSDVQSITCTLTTAFIFSDFSIRT